MSEAADKPFGALYVHVELSGKSQQGTCPAVCRRFVKTRATEQKIAYRQWHRHHHSPSPPATHSLPKMSSDLHELQKWSWAVRGEQLLHLLHTSYATGNAASVWPVCYVYNCPYIISAVFSCSDTHTHTHNHFTSLFPGPPG